MALELIDTSLDCDIIKLKRIIINGNNTNRNKS